MSAATITPAVLSPNALSLVCGTIRRTITEAMNDSCFTGAERKRCYQTIKDCDDVQRLQSYQRSVFAEIKRRAA